MVLRLRHPKNFGDVDEGFFGGAAGGGEEAGDGGVDRVGEKLFDGGSEGLEGNLTASARFENAGGKLGLGVGVGAEERGAVVEAGLEHVVAADLRDEGASDDGELA